jgi:hypothetical protein
MCSTVSRRVRIAAFRQKLAMLELRSVTANLARSFDLRFADGLKSQYSISTNIGKLDVTLGARRDV